MTRPAYLSQKSLEISACSTSWRVGETNVKVGSRWKYLFRAVDKHGRLIDFMLLERRNTRSAHRF